MLTTSFSPDEIRALANTLAEIIMPQIQDIMKNKAVWTVNELSALSAEYLSVKELSEQFHVSERHIRDLIEEGMPHVRVGNAIRIERSLVQQAIRDGKLI